MKHTETGIIIPLQIYSEFNQIFDKEMIAIIKDIAIWEDTRPKILEAAKS